MTCTPIVKIHSTEKKISVPLPPHPQSFFLPRDKQFLGIRFLPENNVPTWPPVIFLTSVDDCDEQSGKNLPLGPCSVGKEGVEKEAWEAGTFLSRQAYTRAKDRAREERLRAAAPLRVKRGSNSSSDVWSP